jgi:hypothetical protein
MPTFACPHCGQPHSDSAAFCPNTGQKLTPPAAAPGYSPPAAQQHYAAPQSPPGHAQPQAQQPYAQQPYAHQHQPHAQQPYAQQPYAQQPYAHQHQPHAQQPHAQHAHNPAFGQQPGAHHAPHVVAAPRPAGVRHAYPLAVREASFGTAVGLVMKTLPYALARFGILLGVSIVTVIWWVVAIGGWGLLGSSIHPGVGFAWFLVACAIYGSLWQWVVRYGLYLLKCGHIAVLTELMTEGRIGDGSLGMFAHGKEVVRTRFGQVTALFAVDQLIKGVVRAFNRTLGSLASFVPIPGLSSVVGLINAVVYAATTYLDETIFSYGIARRETNPWASAKDGLIYYAQNSKEILKTGVWIVVLDKVLTVVLWGIMLMPAFLVAWVLPAAWVGVGFWFVFGFAALLAGNVRAAFFKPVFLVMIMAKFHVTIENQQINQEWDERLARASDKFRKIGEQARDYRPQPALAPA